MTKSFLIILSSFLFLNCKNSSRDYSQVEDEWQKLTKCFIEKSNAANSLRLLSLQSKAVSDSLLENLYISYKVLNNRISHLDAIDSIGVNSVYKSYLNLTSLANKLLVTLSKDKTLNNTRLNNEIENAKNNYVFNDTKIDVLLFSYNRLCVKELSGLKLNIEYKQVQ